MKKYKFNCTNCGKRNEKYLDKRRQSKNHFCGKKCNYKWKENRIKFNCELCEKEIIRKFSRYGKHKYHFCGRKCMGNWRKGRTHLEIMGKEKAEEMRIKQCKRMSGKNNSMYGYKMTKEQKELRSKISKNLPNVIRTQFKKGQVSAFKGYKHSKERRKKLSEQAMLRVGEKNPNWLGGISFEPYTKNFNDKFKRAVRKRDNQICMLCFIHREKLNEALSVHHINYDKKLTIKENCVSLCRKCHTKTNINRKHWYNFFQGLLTEKYRYKYENNLIIYDLREVKNE